jgi:hypothetical protein
LAIKQIKQIKQIKRIDEGPAMSGTPNGARTTGASGWLAGGGPKSDSHKRKGRLQIDNGRIIWLAILD